MNGVSLDMYRVLLLMIDKVGLSVDEQSLTNGVFTVLLFMDRQYNYWLDEKCVHVWVDSMNLVYGQNDVCCLDIL